MNINPFSAANIFSSMAGTSKTAAATTDPSQSTNDMFLQLLTAQLKNQSPLDPVDPTQFTSQLVQFNMLDELTQIRALLQQATVPGTSSTQTPASASKSIPGAH